ncbi:MAG: XdhC family protein [Myxococcota bacterium]
MKATVLDALLEDVSAKRPVVLITDLATGEQRLLHPGEGRVGSERETVQASLRDDRCVTVDANETSQFYQPFNPPLRMVIVGAVHITQALATIAAVAGYEVLVVDPRAAFASADRFEGVAVDSRWPDEALENAALDARSAVVTLTHDPKLDDPALAVALRSDAFYVGSLGSKKTHASRQKRLRKAGFADEEIARVHGPVGLAIGSRTPEEIAVSILAEVTEALRRPKA